MNKNKTTKPNANAVGAHDCARKNQNILRNKIANIVGAESISARRINNDKHNANIVGAGLVPAQNSRGITLIALIITIIVMLILVGVSVTIAINGGLFGTAKNAAKKAAKAKNAEQQLANGRIQIDGTWYDSFEDYLIGKASENQQIGDLNESNTKFIYEPAGWTNGEVKVKIETTALTEGYTLQYSTDGFNWNDYTTETKIKMSVNGAAIYARLLDSEENPGDVATGNVGNIDTLPPKVALEPNGGNYTMPSTGNAKISTKITVADQEATKTDGCSGLDVLQYAWNTSSTTEPSDWTTFTNGDTVTKSDITSAGTWYLWTKVTDKAGNRSEEIKVSNAFTISGAGAEENKITLTPSTTGWTNEDVTVTASYGANLIGTKTLTCTGTENIDYIVNGTESVVVKTNEITVTAKVKDLAGNEVVEEFKVEKIDKEAPTILTDLTSGMVPTQDHFAVACAFKDSDSGYSKAEVYYRKKDSDDAFTLGPAPTNLDNTYLGNVTYMGAAFDITEASSSTTYEAYALIYDRAGNVTRTPEEGTMEVTTESPEPPLEASSIKANPIAYYGAEVTGYTAGGVDKWRIFYADENNIYLIADDYVPYSSLPTTTNGESLTKTTNNYKARWTTDILNSYSGSEWIIANSKAKAWLSKFLNSYPSSSNINIKAVAYMMDTNKWSKFAGDKADYAIGGPTLEMFCASYKDTHPSRYVQCDSVTSKGYQVKWSDGSFADGLAKDDFNSIYIKTTYTKASFMWLSSPSAGSSLQVLKAVSSGAVTSRQYDLSDGGGFRPLVCLKSGVSLTKISDGEYSIN